MRLSRHAGARSVILAITTMVLLVAPQQVEAAAFVSADSGAWDNPATWNPAGVPGAGDTVTIGTGHTVTVSTATVVDGIAIDTGGAITNSSTLTVNGNVSVTGTGTITNSGTLSITGSLSGTGSLVQSINATLALSGAAAPTITTLDTTSNMPNTVRYDGGVQTAASITYSNLTFAGTGAKTWTPSTVNSALTMAGTASYTAAVALTIGGDLNVQGGTLSIANTILVNGATTLSGGGTFAITNVAGTKTFVGDVTINGGTWDNSAVAEPVALSGSLIYIAGTFTSGTSIYTMSGDGAALSGGLTVQALTVSTTGRVTAFGSPTVGALVITLPATVTNDGSLRVVTSLTGSGTIINATNRTLFYEGTGAPSAVFDMTTNTPNTVNYSRDDGTNQATRATTEYHHLTFSGSGAKTGATNVTVRGQFTIAESATWTPGTALVTFLGDMVVDTDQAVPVTAAAGTNLTWDTPAPAVATSITGTSVETLTLTLMNFNNLAGVSTTKTVNPTTVTVGGGASFTNNGTFSPTTLIVSGAASFTNNQTLNAGTLTVNGGGTFTNSVGAEVTVTGTTSVGSTGAYVNHGTTNANGLISGTGTLTNRANAVLNFGMTAANVPTISNLDLTTHTPNTVSYMNGAVQNIRAGAYSNLELATSGTKTALGSLTVNGTFILSGTAAFSTGVFTHNFAGSWVHDSAVATPLVATGSTINFNAPSPAAATTISGGGAATLAFAAVNVNTTSGLTVGKTITSTGPLVVNGLLVNGGGGSITLLSTGGLTVANGGTLTNTGTIDLSAGGTVHVGPTGAAVFTNTGVLTVGGLIDGQGTLTNGAGGTLNYQNATAPTLTTMDFATHASNSVNYSLGGAQTIRAGSYRNLGVATSGTKTAAGSLSVAGTMTLSGTAGFAPLGFTHTFSGNWVNGLNTSVTPGGILIFNGASALISGGGTLALAEAQIATGAAIESLIAMSVTTLLTVQSGATLTLNGTVSGTGAFTVEDGATLGIRSAAGIAAAGASGNVQTSGARTFSSGATYRYNNNSGNPQVTGSGLPATVRNLVINNPQGVTLTSVVAVSEDYTLTSGALANPGASVSVTVLPATSGTLSVGQVLTTTDGTWGGAPVFTYQWQRCSPVCVDIDGATADSYLIDAADSGARLRVLVTATQGGSLTVSSVRTTEIGGSAPPPPPPGGGGGGGAVASIAPVPVAEPGIGPLTFEPNTGVVQDFSGSGPTVATSTSETASVIVHVPSGALVNGTELRLGFVGDVEALLEVAPPPDGSEVIAAFVAQALTSQGVAITSDFAAPVTIDLTVPASSVPDGATVGQLVFTFWNGSTWVVTPATITINADGSVRVQADVLHFTVFALFRQPSPAWFGILPQAEVSFSIWRGFTGTESGPAAGLATPQGLGMWRLNPETQRYQSWVATSPAFANDLTSLMSGDLLFVRTRAARPPTTPAALSSAPTGGSTAPITYTVTAVDTLTGIGARFGIDWLQIAAANGIAGPNYFIHTGQVLSIPRPTATPIAGTSTTRTHVVSSSDTLSSIGAQYGVDWLQIAAANGIAGPNYFVHPGQVLSIPAPRRTLVTGTTVTGAAERTHVVGAGDTLSAIAEQYGVPSLTIAEANGLTGPLYIVRSGQVLRIP